MWRNIRYKQDIRPALIKKSLEINHPKIKLDYHEIKLHNRFINKLFNKYQVQEYTVHFYDADEDYEFAKGLSKNEFEEKRLNYNTWTDVFGPGIWGMSQKQVDCYAKQVLDWFRKGGHLQGRCWLGYNDKILHLYCYGRDIYGYDLHFVMLPRARALRMTKLLPVAERFRSREEDDSSYLIRYEMKDKNTGVILKDYSGNELKGSIWSWCTDEYDRMSFLMDRNDLKGVDIEFLSECMTDDEFHERFPDEE